MAAGSKFNRSISEKCKFSIKTKLFRKI